MQTIEISEIIIKDRQRKEIGPTKLQELKRGILSKGLLHAPVLSIEPDGSYRLRAGERRLKAMAELHAECNSFFYDGVQVPENHIPYVLTSELSEDDLYELELEENLLRENLTWMEEAEARAALHALRKTQNPKQTVTATAKEVAAAKGSSLSQEQHAIARANIIVAHKDNPRVKRAKSEGEAIKALLDESETKFRAKLSALSVDNNPSHHLIKGDCREELPKLASNSVNTIICDPPYGIEADKAGQESKHFYDDSADYALEICEFILREGFRIATPRAILFMFCDIEHFVRLKTYASQQCWSVYRVPLIWDKGRGGRAPWGRAGFERSYEIMLFAVKGQDELVYPGGRDILSFPPPTNKDRTHAAQKPVELLKHLLKLSTLPGETVLDPCAGSGPIISAANRLHIKSICIEQDETYYSQALVRASGGEENLLSEESDDDLSSEDSSDLPLTDSEVEELSFDEDYNKLPSYED